LVSPEGWLVSHSCAPLIVPGGYLSAPPHLVGWLLVPPHSQQSFLTLPSLSEFSYLPHPHSLKLVQCSTPTSLTVVNYIHCLCHSVSLRVCGSTICPCDELNYVPRRAYGAHLLDLQIHTGRFASRLVGKSASIFSQSRGSLGQNPGWQGICRLNTS
jgi:hypothetical protein